MKAERKQFFSEIIERMKPGQVLGLDKQLYLCVGGLNLVDTVSGDLTSKEAIINNLEQFGGGTWSVDLESYFITKLSSDREHCVNIVNHVTSEVKDYLDFDEPEFDDLMDQLNEVIPELIRRFEEAGV